MKKLKKLEIYVFDPYNSDDMLDRLLEVKDKLNELIEVVNQMNKEKTVKEKKRVSLMEKYFGEDKEK